MRGGKFGVQCHAERNVQLLEQSADARNTPVDPVLAEGLIHQIRVAGRQVRAKDRALAEAELLDKQDEAEGDFFAGGPGNNVDRVARKPGDRVSSVLRQNPRGMCNGEQQKQSGDDAGLPGFPSHDAPCPCLGNGNIR